MHLPRNALAAPLLLPCILAAQPALEWRAELSSTEAATLYARHGDEIGLSCRLALRGEPYAPASALCHYQTNGMGAAWWEAPVSIASNVATVAWSPALDPGADLVLLLLEFDGAHRAAAHLHLRPGPSGGSALPPPTAVLDFAAVRYTNAPWALPSDIPPAPDLSAYATTGQVAEAIASIPEPDLTPYATWQGLDAATNACLHLESSGDLVVRGGRVESHFSSGYAAFVPDGFEMSPDGQTLFFLNFPDADGTIAIAEDIPEVPSSWPASAITNAPWISAETDAAALAALAALPRQTWVFTLTNGVAVTNLVYSETLP